jgi:ABC-type antimicrobial peptide transport system permease subunit
VSGQPSTHGIVAGPPDEPLPVAASEAFLESTGLREGDVTQIAVNSRFFDVRIAGTYRFFPTLPDPRETPSLVVDRDALLAIVNANPRGSLTYPDEVWLQAPAGAVASAREASAAGALNATIVSFEELRIAQQEDPLIAAGWEGILFISFAAILLLSALGFLIYSYLTAQKRTLEFAVLRTMGFSRRQIASVVGFEQVFIIAMGMLAGTLMGLRLGALMIRYMGVTETGADVLPPMLLHVDWLTITTAWLVLALAFLATIGVVVLLYARLSLHRVLRIGET